MSPVTYWRLLNNAVRRERWSGRRMARPQMLGMAAPFRASRTPPVVDPGAAQQDSALFSSLLDRERLQGPTCGVGLALPAA
jgi:hypothetical protein